MSLRGDRLAKHLRSPKWGLVIAREIASEIEESRTRWHLGLVVSRVASTPEQRLRAARTMSLLAEDQSNAVRCSAMEGIGWMALHSPSLRGDAEEMIQRFLREGTPAMKCRARQAQKRLLRAPAQSADER